MDVISNHTQQTYFESRLDYKMLIWVLKVYSQKVLEKFLKIHYLDTIQGDTLKMGLTRFKIGY